jgi:hypothetical protein
MHNQEWTGIRAELLLFWPPSEGTGRMIERTKNLQIATVTAQACFEIVLAAFYANTLLIAFQLLLSPLLEPLSA